MPAPSSSKRKAKQRAERQGRRAEALATLYLRLKGYRILARRKRLPMIEVDILARKGPRLILVEVKYRNTLEAAHTALTPDALRRLQQAAAHLARMPLTNSKVVFAQVDLILVAPWRWPLHLEALT